jgi:hypothetical protein
MKRVYVAGSYSADNMLGVFENMRKGMIEGKEVLLAGFAAFVPWFDHHFFFMLRDGETITIEQILAYSIAWLEVSDYMLVLPNSKGSKGTQKEIELAKERNIPIFCDLQDLIIYDKSTRG